MTCPKCKLRIRGANKELQIDMEGYKSLAVDVILSAVNEYREAKTFVANPKAQRRKAEIEARHRGMAGDQEEIQKIIDSLIRKAVGGMKRCRVFFLSGMHPWIDVLNVSAKQIIDGVLEGDFEEHLGDDRRKEGT